MKMAMEPKIRRDGSPLHSTECQGLSSDVERMIGLLASTPTELAALAARGHMFPIHAAVQAGHLECLRVMLDTGAYSPDVLNPHGCTPMDLALAAPGDVLPVVQLLLGAGANPDRPCVLRGDSPTRYLEESVEKRRVGVVRCLLEHGASTEHCYLTEEGQRRLHITTDSPLIAALWEEQLDIARLLLLHGADLGCYCEKNSVPHIIIASFLSTAETLQLYHEFGGNVWQLQPDLMDRTTEDETALQSLHRVPCVYQFRHGGPPEVERELETLMRTPRSLQSACRLAIFRAVGREYWRKVNELPLPPQLIRFLDFQEFDS